MKDYLLDIVDHTLPLGCVDFIRVDSDETSTAVSAVGNDKTVVIMATFKKPLAAFNGTFGLPNLQKLNTILNIPEYKEDAIIDVVREEHNGEAIASGLHFANAVGDFKNDYRFMKVGTVNEKFKSPKFKGVNWSVEFTPTQQAIQRFKFMSQANSEETIFNTKTEKGALKFYFGDHSTHAGNFVFHNGISGSLNKSWNWPVARFMSILALQGDKVIRFSDEGAAEITIDSGLIEYRYVILAQIK